MSDVELPEEIAERRIRPAEILRIRDWIQRTRALAADGLVRPDVGELAELLAAVVLSGTRAPRGERVWDVRRPGDGSLVQVKSVWHLPHRRRQNLGDIAKGFSGDIWVVEFARDLSVRSVRTLPGPCGPFRAPGSLGAGSACATLPRAPRGEMAASGGGAGPARSARVRRRPAS
jgi:hypothetical protein